MENLFLLGVFILFFLFALMICGILADHFAMLDRKKYTNINVGSVLRWKRYGR